MRTASNQTWEAGQGNERQLTIAELLSDSAAADYAAGAAPPGLQLEVGNQCNLKCRMCNGKSSSRIARDAVHSAWANAWSARASATNWVHDPVLVRNHVLQYAGQVRYISFYGGETLLIKEVGDVLQFLVDEGLAAGITLRLHTNATSAQAPWLKLTEKFHHMELGISLDGYNKLNDYIRYPSRWPSVVENIDRFKQLANATLIGAVVLQAYNLLHLVELFRFFDTVGVMFYANPLLAPTYLGADALPLRVRRLAAERLRAYSEVDCPAWNHAHVLSLIAWIEGLGEEDDERLLREFMLFTNDLDATRGQSLRAACPELVALIEEASFPWINDTLHAGRRPLALAERTAGGVPHRT